MINKQQTPAFVNKDKLFGVINRKYAIMLGTLVVTGLAIWKLRANTKKKR